MALLCSSAGTIVPDLKGLLEAGGAVFSGIDGRTHQVSAESDGKNGDYKTVIVELSREGGGGMLRVVSQCERV